MVVINISLFLGGYIFRWELFFLHGMVLGFDLGMFIMILDIDSGTWSSQSIQMSSADIPKYVTAQKKKSLNSTLNDESHPKIEKSCRCRRRPGGHVR